MSVLKDVAQAATDLAAALAIVSDANRTCNLIIGVGSGRDGSCNLRRADVGVL
jgi:soluble P-type ATPase